jgi:hypothetical protein
VQRHETASKSDDGADPAREHERDGAHLALQAREVAQELSTEGRMDA